MLRNYSNTGRNEIVRLSLHAIRKISSAESYPYLSRDHRSHLIMHPISALVLRSVSPYYFK